MVEVLESESQKEESQEALEVGFVSTLHRIFFLANSLIIRFFFFDPYKTLTPNLDVVSRWVILNKLLPFREKTSQNLKSALAVHCLSVSWPFLFEVCTVQSV